MTYAFLLSFLKQQHWGQGHMLWKVKKQMKVGWAAEKIKDGSWVNFLNTRLLHAKVSSSALFLLFSGMTFFTHSTHYTSHFLLTFKNPVCLIIFHAATASLFSTSSHFLKEILLFCTSFERPQQKIGFCFQGDHNGSKPVRNHKVPFQNQVTVDNFVAFIWVL